ncbi:hypothetical protein NQ176_g7005 [Zarea fungicola]|uniref:Uncharacterized protein n=1 Tax=Zarea fungicola TaxID=93591 RepID=A0ACC1N2P0_9HYPO|nr:hypothetical protein NQ176_g7005 [Lecanicillium fungicola]
MISLTLYHANGFSSLGPHLLLNELQVEFTSVVMKLGSQGMEAADGSLSNADYRKIHPSGFVPALSVDGVVITELPAILTYIGSLASPEKGMLGADALQRAQVTQWLAWLSGTWHAQGVAMVFRSGRFSDDQSHHAAIAKKGRTNTENGFERVNGQLAKTGHLVGDQDTVADFALPIFLVWSKRMGIPDINERYPAFASFMRRMEQKRSLKEVAKAEGLETFFC